MNATFTAPRTAHSLRLHFVMEKQHRLEIGQRIRELRENSAETNRSIAEAVGVGERSVAAWVAGGGIAYDNAKKVADLFGVDVDYIWRGRSKGATPDLMGDLSSGDELLREVALQMAELAQAIDRIETRLQGLELSPPKPGEGQDDK